MLPKPKFDLNARSAPPVGTNCAPPSAGSWFQYNPNQSLNQQSVNNYPNYGQNYSNNNYNAFGNNFQPSLWHQNNYNPSYNLNANNVWNGSHNQNNVRFNQNFNQNLNQNHKQHNHRNDYQNKRFKDNNQKSFKNNGNGNKAFNCDACCRWFPNEELYNQHLSEHILCGLDECTFRAHPKVIESHQKMQHFCFKDRTLVKKFMSLQTEEDIDKWKEERKRNFPTKDNIKKKQELVEKQRLEVLEQKKKIMLKEIEDKERHNNHIQTKQKTDNCFEQKSKKNKKSSKGKGKLNLINTFKNNRKLTLFQKLMLNEKQEENEEKSNEKEQ